MDNFVLWKTWRKRLLVEEEDFAMGEHVCLKGNEDLGREGVGEEGVVIVEAVED